MERHGRGKGKQRLLGSHQKCWIWGRNAVLETLAAGRWEILELQLSAALEPGELERAQALAQRQGLAPRLAPPDSLTSLCRSSEHQGYLARMTDFPYSPEEETCAGLAQSPAVALLDSIQDPYNFGAILRSAEILGLHAVFIGEKEQVGVTSMVVRASAGAVNRIPVVRVSDIGALAARLKGRGLRLAAASEKAERSVFECDFKGPTAVIIGNEGRGVGPELLRLCDETVKIPQVGKIGSLNAAVAASLFFYEILRQRTVSGKG